MKLVVLKMEAMDESKRRKAMKAIADVRGAYGVDIDMEAKIVAVTGNVDAVSLALKLRKICHTELVSIAPVEKKEEKGKKKKKKAENNSNNNNDINNCVQHGSYSTNNSYVDGKHEESNSECRIS